MTVTRVRHSPVVTRQVRRQTGKSVHGSGSQSEAYGQAQAWLCGVGDRYTYTIAQGAIESHGLSLNGAPEPMGKGVGGGPMAGWSGQLSPIRYTQGHFISAALASIAATKGDDCRSMPSKYKCSYQVTGDQTPLTCTSSASLHLPGGYRWILPLSPLGANSTVFTIDIKAPCPPPLRNKRDDIPCYRAACV